MTEQERLDDLKKLREPFDKSAIGKIPRGNIKLDYVGHANVTARLLNVDPFWTWEPVAFDEQGLPALIRDSNGNPRGLWIRLTVCDVTRLGFGSCEPGKADPIKELIGDALRNASMRFGVALDLWSKEELEASPEAHPPQTSKPQAGEEVSGEPLAESAQAEPQASLDVSPPDSAEGGDGTARVGGEVSEGKPVAPSADDQPPATDLVSVYGDGKVLATARRLAKVNNITPQPLTVGEISAPLAALVGKELEKVNA